MSVNYASGLSEYEHKGKCGMPETLNSPEEYKTKVAELVKWVRESKHLVVITGAGVSTSAGIPDFRGPKGVWTLEEKGESPEMSVTFETAVPTYTHRALVALEKSGYVKYVISQNVDGLHVRSGLPRNRLAELHGNMFVEECEQCRTQYIRSSVVSTMALQLTGNKCSFKKPRSTCRGKLRDTILDWEDNLPDKDLDLADENCRKSDLCICLGTSLQILPCGNMPLLTKKNQGKICIVSLQPTKQDKKCNLKINYYCDDVMQDLCTELGVTVPQWEQPKVVLQSVHGKGKEKTQRIVVDQVLLPHVVKVKNDIDYKMKESGNASLKRKMDSIENLKDSKCDVALDSGEKKEKNTCVQGEHTGESNHSVQVSVCDTVEVDNTANQPETKLKVYKKPGDDITTQDSKDLPNDCHVNSSEAGNSNLKNSMDDLPEQISASNSLVTSNCIIDRSETIVETFPETSVEVQEINNTTQEFACQEQNNCTIQQDGM